MTRCRPSRMKGERELSIADVSEETGLSGATNTLLCKERAQKSDFDALQKLCMLFNY